MGRGNHRSGEATSYLEELMEGFLEKVVSKPTLGGRLGVTQGGGRRMFGAEEATFSKARPNQSPLNNQIKVKHTPGSLPGMPQWETGPDTFLSSFSPTES